MILIATKDKSLGERLQADLSKVSIATDLLSTKCDDFVAKLYNKEVTGIIIDEDFEGLPHAAMVDLVNSIARRLPIIVLRAIPTDAHKAYTANSHEFNDSLTVIGYDNYEDIFTTASLFSGTIFHGIKSQCKTIPFYNPRVPVSMLTSFGGLGILTVDASSFNKISVQYGSDVYAKMKDVFHDILFDLWGKSGCFRDSDLICRKSMSSNSYVIFMNRSRDTGGLPYPGALEKIADRVALSIQNALWDELFAPRSKKRIPSCVETIPLVGVGFFGVLNNPCIDVQEILDSGLESSKMMAISQQKRGRERQRELMQTLIQSDDLLTPFYQGVFNLQAIDEKLVKQVKESNSIAPLKDHIFGFESLIRVNQEGVSQENNFESGLDSRYLRPDVLFSLAKTTKVALELDQACMRHAARDAGELPGTLMINILPRNLYYIGKLKQSLKRKNKLMFEISESEAISNFELMMKSRDLLEQDCMGIAADDFGKGYSSLERIIKIRPHVIKFDRGMIQEIDKDPVKQAYVKGLVKAAKILNTTILAEGVETWEEASILKSMGVELIQGFLLHRPQDISSILKQLDQEASEGLGTVA